MQNVNAWSIEWPQSASHTPNPTVIRAQNCVITHATVNAQWDYLEGNVTSLGGESSQLENFKFFS